MLVFFSIARVRSEVGYGVGDTIVGGGGFVFLAAGSLVEARDAGFGRGERPGGETVERCGLSAGYIADAVDERHAGDEVGILRGYFL